MLNLDLSLVENNADLSVAGSELSDEALKLLLPENPKLDLPNEENEFEPNPPKDLDPNCPLQLFANNNNKTKLAFILVISFSKFAKI